MSLAPVSLEGHPLEGVSLIEASAGTGKTYTITHLYLRFLLERELEVENILVVTFTNAATQELKGRIQELIRDVLAFISATESHEPSLDPMFERYVGDRQAIDNLKKALIGFDLAAIFSIHGFCQRVLNSFPLETGTLLAQDIVSDERELEMRAIEDFWRKSIVPLDMPRLQWITSIWPSPEALLRDVRPLQFHLDQFDSDIADNDDSQLQQLWQILQQAWANHQAEVRATLVDNPALNANRIRRPTVMALLDSVDELFKAPLPYSLPSKWELLSTEKLQTCLKKGQQDSRINNAFFRQTAPFAELHQKWVNQQKIQILLSAAHELSESVSSAKLASQQISFNDLVQQLAVALKNGSNQLGRKVTRLFPVAMVDEFQDTDYQQYRIFNSLYHNDDDHCLIMIGDPKQAIYGFRGADVFSYQLARRSTHSQYTLDTNYRSTADYVDMVNQLFSAHEDSFNLPNLIHFERAAAKPDQPEFTENQSRAEPLICWLHPWTEKPITKEQASRYFSRKCAVEIQRILNQQSLAVDNRALQAKDLAVLVKTGYQASQIQAELAARGISSALISRDSVFSTLQAQEINLLLDVLIDPADLRRLFGLMSTQLFGWTSDQIEALQHDDQALVELLDNMRCYRDQWDNHGILAMFLYLLDRENLLQRHIQHIDGERRLTNWLHVVESLQEQAASHASHSQTLHWLKQQRLNPDLQNENDQLRLESDDELVRIVTVHRSKGLEYPVVFLPFMWDVRTASSLPASYSYHDDQGKKHVAVLDERPGERWYQEKLAEEARLFYVAMTRACYRTYLAWASVKDSANSAIAHCLYQDQISGDYPKRKLTTENPSQWEVPWHAINQQKQLVRLDQITELEQSVKASELRSYTPTHALNFSRRMHQAWRISSYSQLASHSDSGDFNRPDYDEIATTSPVETDESASEDSRFTFFKGARAGSFLHDLLENQNFHQVIDEQLIKLKLQEYGFDIGWKGILANWLQDILNKHLDSDLSLSRLLPDQCVKEMEFYMTCDGLVKEPLNQILHTNNYLAPGSELGFEKLTGFMKGFIDLVFEHEGRFYVADYKSNYLGAENSAYQHRQCEQAMYDHQYHLQLLIYSLALHRYLTQHLPDYRYAEHFGGAYYLFIRGMSSNDSQPNGIYFHRPEAEVIGQLEAMFGNG